MINVGDLISRAVHDCARLVSWTLASVDDDAREPHVIPMPGPAHGPVPAIDLRLEDQRRKPS
jgi:hypothetical protein